MANALDDPYLPQMQDISRQRKMADILREQSMQSPQGQVVGGRFIKPHFTNHLAQLLNGYNAGAMGRQADEQERALSTQRQGDRAADYARVMQAGMGTPAVERNIIGTEDATGAPTFSGEMGSPAVPGSRQAMFTAMSQSRDPGMQQLAMAEALKEKKPAELFGKISPHDYTAESIRAFAASGDHSMLVPVRKMEVTSGQVFDPYAVKPGTKFEPQANPVSDMLVKDPVTGQLVPNKPLIEAKKAVAKAGASTNNVNVNTATKPMLNEIGKGVGESVNNAFGAAQQAQQTINNVQQIRSGLGNAIVGPAAGTRVKLAQIGEVLGVNGASTTEKLQNTRNVIQGLARQELAAAGQMKGQGQITEAERGILKRAEAGSIEELTVPEINTLLGALEKTANHRIGVHNSNLERLRKDPNAAGVADYMTLPGGDPKPPSPADVVRNASKPKAADSEAVTWAKANPNDPRAKRILELNRGL